MIGSRTFEDEFAYGFDDPIDTRNFHPRPSGLADGS